MKSLMKRVLALPVSAILAISVAIPMAYAAEPSPNLTSGAGNITTQANVVTQKSKTYWYHASFMPKSQAYGVKDAGCTVKTTKSAFKITGKITRMTNPSTKANSKLLSKKTRTFKVANKVTFYGSQWTADTKSTKTKSEILNAVKQSSKAKYGAIYFKVSNGKVKEVRMSVA